MPDTMVIMVTMVIMDTMVIINFNGTFFKKDERFFKNVVDINSTSH